MLVWADCCCVDLKNLRVEMGGWGGGGQFNLLSTGFFICLLVSLSAFLWFLFGLLVDFLFVSFLFVIF